RLAIRRAGMPLLPLVIGFVLGNLAEKSFLITLSIHDGAYDGFFDSGVSFVLIVIIAGLIVHKVLRSVVKR
ncbi:MAG: tripartite tricarboxylate transporter permease, partial [Deltaproteobacteria bacterium]|nr:tripartite tricarboxylate transporter permease [Deltaproteobacteria bacterium]